MHTYIQTYIQTYIHACKHTHFKYTYIHQDAIWGDAVAIYTYACTLGLRYRFPGSQSCSIGQKRHHTYIHTHILTCIYMHAHTLEPRYRFPGSQSCSIGQTRRGLWRAGHCCIRKILRNFHSGLMPILCVCVCVYVFVRVRTCIWRSCDREILQNAMPCLCTWMYLVFMNFEELCRGLRVWVCEKQVNSGHWLPWSRRHVTQVCHFESH